MKDPSRFRSPGACPAGGGRPSSFRPWSGQEFFDSHESAGVLLIHPNSERGSEGVHPKIKGQYLIWITKTRDGFFVSSLVPVATRSDDARPMTRGERIMWRVFRRPPKVV